MSSWKQSLLRPAIGLALGLALGLGLAAFAGESPWHVLKVIVHSAFGSRYDFGLTLYYATPLIFTGLSVAVAFHAGLFNVGAEGQLSLGALAATIAALSLPGVPAVVAPFVAMGAALAVGALWGWIPGWLRARRGAHEVITTIMLNFIAAAIASWAVTAWLQSPDSQNPETHLIPPAYFFRSWDPMVRLFHEAPVSLAFPAAVFTALALWAFLWKTPWGFELRACGENEDAARLAGINVGRTRQFAMALAGALAGCVALGEVLGGAGRYRLGFSPDYGFIGIAVALLARNHHLGILWSALLFGALHKGAADLDIETDRITKDISLVIQALVILSVSIASAWKGRGRGRK
jgi:simple sugar transport system permease protein